MLGPVRGHLPVVRVEPQRVEQRGALSVGPVRARETVGYGRLVQHLHALRQRLDHGQVGPAGQQSAFQLAAGGGIHSSSRIGGASCIR